MLQGFPKSIKTTKIGNHRYRIERDDGYVIEVSAGSKGDWYQLGTIARRQTLSQFKYDMRMGYMAHDQLANAEEAAWFVYQPATNNTHKFETEGDAIRFARFVNRQSVGESTQEGLFGPAPVWRGLPVKYNSLSKET